MVLGKGIELHYLIQGEDQARTRNWGKAERDGTHGLKIYDEGGIEILPIARIVNWSILAPDGQILDSDVAV